MAEGINETNSKRPVFGSRLLEDPSQVYKHNAWDNVDWNEEQEQLATEKVILNSTVKLSTSEGAKYEDEAAGFWHSFYQQHQNRFFKDRHWLFTEFPELRGLDSSHAKRDNKFCVFEVGCGAGNTVFPILQTNSYPKLFVYCCDFADSAIQIVKSHDLYDSKRCCAFQYDIGSHEQPLPFLPQSLDVIILIFVLSALQPDTFQTVINFLSQYLKPGGMVLFRDYGRYDMAQLRFKKGKCLADNFYVRGDGTRVYFFTEDEVDSLMSKAGLLREQLYTDRRLQVNRGRQLKMYRVWIQAKYRKARQSLTSDSMCRDTENVVPITPSSGDAKSVVPITQSSGDAESVVPITPSSGTAKSVVPITQSSGTAKSVVPITPSSGTAKSVIPITQSSGDAESVVPITPSSGTAKSVVPITQSSDDVESVVPITQSSGDAESVVPITQSSGDTESVISSMVDS